MTVEEHINTPDEFVATKIFLVHGKRVMIDEDLALLYGVPTKRLNEAVKRNIKRFPDDFMFQLTPRTWTHLKSQFATSSWGGRRTMPYAFTEHGILMLSSVLTSDRAIEVNIRIMRIFVRMRGAVMSQKQVLLKVERLEKRVNRSDQHIDAIFRYLKALLTPKAEPLHRIGFKRKGEVG